MTKDESELSLNRVQAKTFIKLLTEKVRYLEEECLNARMIAESALAELEVYKKRYEEKSPVKARGLGKKVSQLLEDGPIPPIPDTRDKDAVTKFWMDTTDA